ncbi:MAG: hypothetical protein RIQ93_792 [Verrucomicrobiota bacterium]|jgi:hypothetical protein
MNTELAPYSHNFASDCRRFVALLCLTLGAASFLGGCATRNTASGGRETNILGGAVAVSTQSFQPPTPATLDVDTSKILGNGDPSGRKVSLFWGLITLRDY